jgi:serine/threonine protein kinase
MNRVVGGDFRLRRKIGAGSFGEIYSGEQIQTSVHVAVKLESVRSKAPLLADEAKIYQILQGGAGIPRIFWNGCEGLHNIMVIDLLGKSLEDLFMKCHRKLSLKTVLMLADQMLSCIEYIHQKNFIHRDIKPENFVMGLGQTANQVFVIDFGLSRKYRDQHTHAHIPYAEGRPLTGTARYASVAALRGTEQSRRDDLESLGNVWIYLLRGTLPGMGITGATEKQRYDRVYQMKDRIPFEDLCRGCPSEFVRYFQIVRSLRFTENPNYAALRNMFRALFTRQNFIYDSVYDWVPPPKPAVVVRQEMATVQGTAKKGKIGGEIKEAKPDDNMALEHAVKPAECQTIAVTPRRAATETAVSRTVVPGWRLNRRQGSG